ncbi:MAG: AAA family ATPase [Candidatus Moranbacteria bacterium]|nr:AAA family ATPase [Candidatus Moranbacteria bacterium]
MGEVLALVNQKGGVGKTTTAVNLSQYLSRYGKKVLLIDLDPQANATSGVGVSKEKLNYSLYDVIAGRIEPYKSIIRLNHLDYELIPATSDLSGASLELTNLDGREFVLSNIVNRLRNSYDYLIIDSPPSLDLLTINGLVASNGVIIPVQCEYYALEGLSRLLQTLSLIKKSLNPGLKIKGAVLTMFDKRNKLARQVVKEVNENFPGNVFETIIPRNVRLSEAPSYGETILNFARFSKGAKAYDNLARELIGYES